MSWVRVGMRESVSSVRTAFLVGEVGEGKVARAERGGMVYARRGGTSKACLSNPIAQRTFNETLWNL